MNVSAYIIYYKSPVSNMCEYSPQQFIRLLYFMMSLSTDIIRFPHMGQPYCLQTKTHLETPYCHQKKQTIIIMQLLRLQKVLFSSDARWMSMWSKQTIALINPPLVHFIQPERSSLNIRILLIHQLIMERILNFLQKSVGVITSCQHPLREVLLHNTDWTS